MEIDKHDANWQIFSQKKTECNRDYHFNNEPYLEGKKTGQCPTYQGTLNPATKPLQTQAEAA